MRASTASRAGGPPGGRPPYSSDDVRRRRFEARRRALGRRRRRLAAAVMLVGAIVAAAIVFVPGREAEQPRAAAVHAPDQAIEGAGARPFTPPHRPRTRPRSPGKRGSLVAVPGASPLLGGGGPPSRFLVEVEGALRIDRVGFARAVERVLGDRRGWSRSGTIAFRRVARGSVDFRVTLASAATTDELCRPLQTNGIFSCYMNGRAVLNFMRWRQGAASYGDDLAGYRRYMVNHEVGHALGRGHASCPAAGARAPVMVQQTKGVAPCRANPWPLPVEIR